jgi:hypothetical protein
VWNATLLFSVRYRTRECARPHAILKGLDAALVAFAGVYGESKPVRKRRKKMSVAARKKIAAAQRARWVKFRAKQKR